MTFVFQCDYCGTFVSVDCAHVSYELRRPLSDDRWLVTAGTFCGRYCSERAASATVPASRG
jgi:hypothetical protein